MKGDAQPAGAGPRVWGVQTQKTLAFSRSVLTFVLFGRCEIVYKSHKHREGWWGLEEALRLSTTKTPRIPQRIFILYTHDRSSVESSRTPHPMLSLVVVAPLAMRPAAARNRVNPRRLGVWYIGKPWSRTCDGA